MEDLIILNDAGVALFTWHAEGIKTDDDLISGFLSAINTFATMERGEDIKKLKLKETTLLFEKFEEYFQKLTFVMTSKLEGLTELLHAVIHDIMDRFTLMFKDSLEREFNGYVGHYEPFKEELEEIFHSYGVKEIQELIRTVDEEGHLKSIVFLDPKSGHFLYVHAKQYINKEKISFLTPLLVNAAKLLYNQNLNENINWITLSSVRNDALRIEIREKIIIIKQFELESNIEEAYLSLEFFNSKDKYIKKPKKLIKIFESLDWKDKIKEIYIVDLFGKIIYSKITDPSYNSQKYIPETISFLTGSKKTCEEIYSRPLFNCSIGGTEKTTTICMNFNNFALTLIGNVNDLLHFHEIQDICEEIFNQLK